MNKKEFIKELDNLKISHWLDFEYLGKEVEVYWRYIDNLYFVAVGVKHIRVESKQEVIDYIYGGSKNE